MTNMIYFCTFKNFLFFTPCRSSHSSPCPIFQNRLSISSSNHRQARRPVLYWKQRKRERAVWSQKRDKGNPVKIRNEPVTVKGSCAQFHWLRLRRCAHAKNLSQETCLLLDGSCCCGAQYMSQAGRQETSLFLDIHIGTHKSSLSVAFSFCPDKN